MNLRKLIEEEVSRQLGLVEENRFVGDFNDIWYEAKALMGDSRKRPYEAVVRSVDGKWTIESSLEPSKANIEVSLDDFIAYFYDEMNQDFYVPDRRDMTDFIKAQRQW